MEKSGSVRTKNPAGVEVISWGIADGQKVYLFRFGNKNGFTMSVTNYGAIVQSLSVPGNDGVFDNVLLGYDQLDEYLADPFYIGALVGRYAGRIAGGSFSLENKKFQLSVTPGGFHHHGGLKGFSRKIWSAGSFQQQDRRGVILQCVSEDGEEGFPGTLKLELIYALTDADEWIVEMKASTDKTTILNLTQHAYFNLTGNPYCSIEDHLLQIPVQGFLPVSASVIPLGEVRDVAGTPFDFMQPRRIGDRIASDEEQMRLADGYDHTWVIKTFNDSLLRPAAMLCDPMSGRKLEVFTTEPSVHFYSGNALSLHEDGAHGFGRRCGLCLETQHFGDSPNQPAFPSTVLHPHEIFESRTTFRFSCGA